jgi:hypothetical protein
MAREITSPAAPARPWMKRSSTRTAAEGARAHATEARRNPTSPTISGRRRPSRSERGPATSWPTARPTRQAVIDSWAAEADAFRSSASSGSAGR